MSTPKSRIYILLTSLMALGYSWLIFNLIGQNSEKIVCPIKLMVGYPCPSCGTTRSVLSLIEGNFLAAFYINPFGFLVFSFLLICPIWLFYDFVFKKETLWICYQKVEGFINNKNIAIPLLLLVVANWVWNISKGL